LANLPSMLAPIAVSLDQLLLDANNPRFSELGEDLNPIPENRFADEKVQAATLERMKEDIFDVSELKDTIKTIGFLPMDRLVVRKWRSGAADAKARYIVIEGNRRLTALKWLMNLHDIGKESFSEEQINNFTNIECLLLNDDLAPASATLILPGLRHVSGIKQWGAYQKAKAVHALRQSGLSPQDSAQSLGLSTKAANSAYKCFLALEQMKQDDEFSEKAEPKMYSYFEEVFRRPNVRAWLSWSDEERGFADEDKRKEFYSWITPGDDGTSKLPEAKSVRDFSGILGDENAMNILRSADGSLTRAIARFEVDHPEDWYPKVTAATSAVRSLTPEMLRGLDDATISTLEQLAERITQALKDRNSLLGQGA